MRDEERARLNKVVITQGGVKKYDFTLDYISQATVTPSTPSGYDSLGPTGGDGSISVGTVGASGVQSWTTSLDQDMNVNCPPPVDGQVTGLAGELWTSGKVTSDALNVPLTVTV